MSRSRHLVAGAALYVGVAGATYYYFKPVFNPGDAGEDGACGSAFDRLAPTYDNLIGREESFMGYSWMRWWLLRNVKGDVLEVSAGTGRNLPYYPLGQMASLTLSDVSASMLQQAEAKYYDELKLGYKHPDTKARFLLADAEHMVSPPGQPPVRVPLPAASNPADGRRGSSGEAESSGGSSSSSSGGGGGGTARPASIWRFKNRQPSGESDPGGTATGASRSSSSSSSDSIDRSAASSSTSSTASRGGSNTASGGGRHTSTARPSASPCQCSSRAAAQTGEQEQAQAGPLSTFAPGSFDVVVDSFGLCSCQDPAQVLRQAAALLRPGGRILLLEHGQSSYSWLNRRLDDAADKHYAKWGCWWNRDMLHIVDQAGLVVDSSSRWHFGTSYMLVTRPAAVQQEEQSKAQ